MRKTAALFCLLLAAAGPGPAQAAEGKPVWRWAAASELYFIMPAAQKLDIDGGGTASVKPWGLGIRAVGSQPFSRTGGLQLQAIKVDKPATGKNTFYLLELLLGMQYISPAAEGRPLRFTAAGYADLGLADSTFYAAPVISAGLLYNINSLAETPNGLTFDLYYRLTDIDLDNVGSGRAGTLKPALGFKLGYIFEGFWTTAPRAAQ
jgi:hypothetical protein